MTTPSTSFDLTASPDGCALAAAVESPASPVEARSDNASDQGSYVDGSQVSSIYAANSDECKLELEKRALQEAFDQRELEAALRRATRRQVTGAWSRCQRRAGRIHRAAPRRAGVGPDARNGVESGIRPGVGSGAR